MNEIQLKQLEADQHALRLVVLAMIDSHPEPAKLKAHLTSTFERVISNAIASPRIADKALDALPKAMQPWLDVLDRRLATGL